MYVHLKSFHTTSQCIEKTSQYHKIYWYKNYMTYSIGCVSKVILVNAYSICFFKFCHLKFLTIVKLFCPLSNILPGCAISFTYSNLFEAMQKDLSCAKLFDCGPKIFWTSRWNRHRYSKHWPYTHTIECVCSKINSSWFNPWFSFYFSSLYPAPYIEWYMC